MRQAHRVDANQKEIVSALFKIGCSVQSLAGIGNGVPDLLVGRAGKNYLMEIKDDEKCKSAQKLTKLEKEWNQRWDGSVVVIHSVSEALNYMNGISVNFDYLNEKKPMEEQSVLTDIKCPDGKCEHEWNGKEVEIEGGMSVTCRKCGMLAINHSILVA